MRWFGIILIGIILMASLAPAENTRPPTPPPSTTPKDPGPNPFRAPQEPQYVPGLIVVKLRLENSEFQYSRHNGQLQTPFNDLNEAIQKFNVHKIHAPFPPTPKLTRKTTHADLTRIRYFYFDKNQDVLEVARYFTNLASVIYAEPLPIHYQFAVPNDPRYNNQWHFQNIMAEAAWDLQKGDSSIIIGIVDSGVDLDHPDIQANLWVNEDEIPNNHVDDDSNGYVDDYLGWDFVGADVSNITPDGDPDQKFNSHGTHVAGIASAVTDNGIGIAGASWNCRIMVTKHAPDEQSRSIYFGYDGIVYMAENGADIINCSWGGGSFSQYGQEIINYAHDLGALVIAAAGNDVSGATYSPPDTPPPHYPASYDHVLSVAATQSNDEITSWSYYGPYVDVAAPGQSILSTIPSTTGDYSNAYASFSGTSMASPLVAGLAALVKSAFPDWSPDQIANQIINSTDDISTIGENPKYIRAGGFGSGRINAFQALTTSAEPLIEIIEIAYNDSIGGNGNMVPEPGETIRMQIYFRNVWGDATNLTVELLTTDYAITLTDNQALLGDVPGGRNIFHNRNDDLVFDILQDVHPHFVHFTLRFSDSSGFSQEIPIKMALKPLLLFVDDDDGNNNVENYYLELLDSLGIVYEYWEHVNRELPEDLLVKYPLVIWSCEWTFPSLNGKDRAEIVNYLDNGGRLFISGQDIGWDLADPTGANVPNEYGRSNGASKTFYNNYLRADYLADQSSFDELSGITSDPIGNGLSFHVYQPGRSSNQQFPSEIRPINGSTSIFNYPNGRSGAIRYAGNYRLVYFAFGGFEAIVEKAVRSVVLPRVVNWLNGFQIAHQPLRDTEDTMSNYPVVVEISSAIDSINTVILYWNTHDTFPYSKVVMQHQGNGVYYGEIPAQANPTDVYYFIFAETQKGTYLPLPKYKFHVGPDLIPPTIQLIGEPLKNTINLKQTFTLTIKATDNLGIDTSSAKLHYWRQGQSEKVVPMTHLGDQLFQGSFQLPENEPRSGYVFYYFSVRDSSSNRNLRYSDTLSFSDTTEYIDGFEEPNNLWDYGQNWGITTLQKHSGNSSISESPVGRYENNLRDSLTLLKYFDLTNAKTAFIQAYIRYFFRPNDYLYIQASGDSGATWHTVYEITGRTNRFEKIQADISQFTGPGSNPLTFRFLVVTDSTSNADGVFIDDVSIIASSKVITAIDRAVEPWAGAPKEFTLNQNFPNPFNPATTIEYGLPKSVRVSLQIFNILGQSVRTLVKDQLQQAGFYKVTWDGLNDQGQPVPSGIYFYRLSTKEFLKTRKMILLR